MRHQFMVQGRRVVVVGAARSGVSAAELLVRRGAIVTLTDLKTEIADEQRLRQQGVEIELGHHVAATFDRADLIVLSPGVARDQPDVARAKSRGIPVIGELELASRWLKGRLIAITGTKGKSTTTTLVGRILNAAGIRAVVGGNIGVPLSSQVDHSTEETVHVVEASSFQLETTETFHPWIAALLNFSPDHLDRHADETEYATAKARIFANQTETDWAVVNADNPPAVALASATRAQIVRYAIENASGAAVFVADGCVWQRTSEGDTPLVTTARIHLPGRHMLSNVAAASAISVIVGAGATAVAEALEGFTGLEHVMEPVATIRGVRFVNDSKATNVEAAMRSIESFDRVVAILGGRFKGGRFEDLRAPLQTRGRGVVAIGEAASLIRKALESNVPVVEAHTMREAVAKAWKLAQPDGVVLLAPACSSFDMFADYAERGRVFKEEVARLAEELSTKK